MELIMSRKIIGKTIINSDILTVWHRGVCLAKTSAAFRHCGAAVAAPQTFALGRRSQAHATKKTTRIKRKTKPKARRRGFFIENFHIYGIAVNAVHNDVREIKIFDKG